MPKMAVIKRALRASFIGVLLIPLALITTACNVPSDQQLQMIFAGNENDFSRLALLSSADKALGSLAVGGKQAQGSMDSERWHEYQALFARLGIRSGMTRRADVPNAVFFCVECEGSAISRDCKGYVYADFQPGPTEANLDAPASGLHFKTLGGHWYLFRDGD